MLRKQMRRGAVVGRGGVGPGSRLSTVTFLGVAKTLIDVGQVTSDRMRTRRVVR